METFDFIQSLIHDNNWTSLSTQHCIQNFANTYPLKKHALVGYPSEILNSQPEIRRNVSWAAYQKRGYVFVKFPQKFLRHYRRSSRENVANRLNWFIRNRMLFFSSSAPLLRVNVTRIASSKIGFRSAISVRVYLVLKDVFHNRSDNCRYTISLVDTF